MYKMIVDVTGIALIPGNGGQDCPGNGSGDWECCCDECDFFLDCFPDWRNLMENQKNLEKTLDKTQHCVYNNQALEESVVDMDD